MTDVGLATARRGVAVSCSGVTAKFKVFDESVSWRILLRDPHDSSEFVALRDISLTVPKGEFVGILGRNGAGKSTLLRTLGGVYPPASGTIYLNGMVSSLFELGGLGNRYITGREYATRFLAFYGTPARRMPALLKDIAEFAELEAVFGEPIHTYSSGMAARLYFATATALEHDVYLIDEVLSVGDEHFQAKCWKRLRDRFTSGASGLLATHDWTAVLKLCREAHILDKGKLACSGRADQVVVEYLNLQRPAARDARLQVQGRYAVTSLEDARLSFSVMANRDVDLAASYSIELLRLGMGWETLLLGNFLPVAATAGHYAVELTIPRLPLAPGTYVLNLFLTSPRSTYSSADFRTYDARSWTYGNGIELTVMGKERASATVIDFDWRIEQIN
jgi:lipopolysaccharide transport system ATP-binding protein